MFAESINTIVLNGKSRSQGRGREPAASETKYLIMAINTTNDPTSFVLKMNG